MDYTLFIAHSVLNIVVVELLLAFFMAVVWKNGVRPVWLTVICALCLLGTIDITIQYTNLVLCCSGSEYARPTHFAGMMILMINNAVENGKAGVFPWPFTEFIIELSALYAVCAALIWILRTAARGLRTKEKTQSIA